MRDLAKFDVHRRHPPLSHLCSVLNLPLSFVSNRFRCHPFNVESISEICLIVISD